MCMFCELFCCLEMNHCIHSFIYACFLQRSLSIIIIRIRVYCFLCNSVGVKNGPENDAFSVEFVLIVMACIHVSLCVYMCGHFGKFCVVCQEFFC